MSTETEDPFRRQLARFNPMNFSQDCSVEGHHARLAMTTEDVVVAVGDGRDTYSSRFTDTHIDGDGAHRTITLRGRGVEVDFEEPADAERFARVLGVRQETATAALAPDGRTVQTAAPSAPGRLPMPGTPEHRSASTQARYVEWSQYALWASTALLAVAALEAIAGVIAVLLVFIGGAPLLGLLYLVMLVGALAIPVCLAALTRAVVYRQQAEAVS